VRATTPAEQVRGALVRAAAAQWSSGRGEISHKSRLSTLRRKEEKEEEEEEEESLFRADAVN
jgi:hypothetical protein